MRDMLETYTVTSAVQVRVLADSIRFRILDLLTQAPMTISQLGATLGFSRANMLYHVRALEQVDLVVLVDKREKGGVLEKYYQAVARTILIAPDIFRSTGASEAVSTLQEWFGHIMQEGLRVAAYKAAHAAAAETLIFSRRQLWLTPATFQDIEARILAILDDYRLPQNVPGERPWAVSLIGYTLLDDTLPEPAVGDPPQ